MPATKPKRPPTRAQLLTGTQLDTTDEEANSRLLNDTNVAHVALAKQVGPSNIVTATLVAGPNVLNHGLGRKPQHCAVTPTNASTSFAWALTSSDTKQATITTVGPTQTNALVSFS